MDGLKLGSLFDGSGGFPLAGALFGIDPVWASEVEPYPIAVTRSHFPGMKHLGDVCGIDGADVEPVDIITFGSPCQDLSVAGKQEGIRDGKRSSLFFQAVRIIQEMREATNGKYPRFAVWENVPGAFGSNRGEDFRAVLQSFAETAGAKDFVPMPPRGKWLPAGCIVGNGWSLAWRTYDAQFWGVPQRRKRIYLVADFGSERAGQILFERESLPGHSEAGGEPGEGTAADAQRGAGGSDFPVLIAKDREGSGKGGKGIMANCRRSYALRTMNEQMVCYSIQGNCIDRNPAQNGNGVSEGVAHTVTAVDRHGVYYPTKAKALTARHDGSQCIDRGPNLVAYEAAAFMGGQGLKGGSIAWCEDGTSPTLRAAQSGTNSVPDVVYPTDHRGRKLYRQVEFGNFTDDGTASTLKERDYKSAVDVVVEAAGRQKGQSRKYVLRRLIPLECGRLQGFPDGWGELEPLEELSTDQAAFWERVRYEYFLTAKGKQVKPYKQRASLIAWINELYSESAEYKMWGNGLALPCAADVIGKIYYICTKEKEETAWSLFG